MKHVELIRKRIVRGQSTELMRLRSFISSLDGNGDVVARLEGESGQQILAEVTDLIMTRLGHQTRVPASSRNSRAQRAAAAVLVLPKGE